MAKKTYLRYNQTQIHIVMSPTQEQRPDGERLQDPAEAERLRVMAQTRSRLDRLPEHTAPEPEGVRKQLADVRQNVETQNVPTTVAEINHRNTQIPWEEVEEASGPRVRFAEYKNKPLWRRMGIFLRLIRGGNDSYGAQFRAESLGKLSDYQKADIVEQLEKLRGRNVNWQTKMVSSLMKTHAEYELAKKGLIREGGDAATASEKVRVQGGDTLQSIMQKRNALPKWEEVTSGTIVGPLQHDGPLPPDTFVYFNPAGYPVYISQREDEQPVVPIYRKAAPPEHGRMPSGWKGGAESYRRFEFLQARLNIGDVLFSNVRRDQSSLRARGYYGLGRMLQGTEESDEAFPYIHSMVVIGREQDGRVKIAHLDGQKDKMRYLQDYVKENTVEAISVGRLADSGKAESLAKNMETMARGDTKYSPLKDVREYGELMEKRQSKGGLTPAEQRRMLEICVCTTVVSKAAEQSGIPELATSPTALDQFKKLEIIDSMNFTDAVKRSGRTRKIKLKAAA